jgi:hypothetical protein
VSSFGIAEFQRVYDLPYVYQVDATVTSLGRQLLARGSMDGTSLKAIEFSVGTGGFNPFNYTEATPANPEVQTLDSSVFTDTIDEMERPNPECACFYCVLETGEANSTLGEIGIWSVIQNSPIPGENGTVMLYAIGHFPMKPKNTTMRMAFRVTAQS